MTYAPRARVIVSPLTAGASGGGPTRKALVLSKVSGVDAYLIRFSDGRKATVSATQLRNSIRS